MNPSAETTSPSNTQQQRPLTPSADPGKRPVLVGIKQLQQRVEDPNAAKEPLALMEAAVRAAALDCGAPSILQRVDSVRVVQGIWNYSNPARTLIERLNLGRGAGSVETGLSCLGGNHVQMMVNESALEIRAGDREVIVLTGAECGRTLGKARGAGIDLTWFEESEAKEVVKTSSNRASSNQSSSHQASLAPDRKFGTSRWTRHPMEMKLGLQQPVHYYSLFELALRFAAKEAPQEHLRRIAELWQGFSAVAQDNPHAWLRKPFSADQIQTLDAFNRPITFPYPKLMNANMRVDMGAALILCSDEVADSLGIAQDLRVYPISGTDANDHYFVSERQDLRSSPAIRIAGVRALELAEKSVSDLDLVDVYSCFPSAVQIAAQELGLDLERPLTVTGGLTFHGGPLNNYVMHAIARSVELLRSGEGATALVTANGGMLTKHSFGVYRKEPAAFGFRHENVQTEVDGLPKRDVLQTWRGEAVIETYCVAFGGSASARTPASYNAIYGQQSGAEDSWMPTVAHLACLTSDGRRTWANLTDPVLLRALCEEEFCGRTVRIDDAGNAEVVD